MAKAVGLFDIFCEPSLLSDLSYMAFLDRLEKAKDAFTELFESRPELRELSLRVCPYV